MDSIHSDKKIFLSDLDGTLLTDQKTITPATRAALDQFAAAGNVFAISTGRPMAGALKVQAQYELAYPGSYVVAFNGAEIYDTSAGKTIYRAEVDLSITEEILAMAAERQIHCQTYRDQYIISPSYNEHLAFYRSGSNLPAIINESVMEEITEPPCKLIAVDKYDKAKLDAFRDEINAKFGDTLTTIFSNDYYLEIFPKEAGKGAALRRLCEYLQIPKSQSLAAGDAENDLSMIQEAGIGIAMKNGSDQVKAAASVITEEDNNHDGLVPFLK